MKIPLLFKFILLFFILNGFTPINSQRIDESRILSFEANPKLQNIEFYWRDNDNNLYGNIGNLNLELAKNNEELIFAVKGGMYQKNQNPQGLYIEKGIIKSKMNSVQNAYGNFYMQPNGIFYLTKHKTANVCTSLNFPKNKDIKFATQSGPMLIIDGKLHTKFNKGSQNVHIRNGVGILPNGNVLFAMSKQKINFYDFATYFQQKGCKNALYLDGFVSRTYLPSKNWTQTDGNFGVIIGVTKKN